MKQRICQKLSFSITLSSARELFNLPPGKTLERTPITLVGLMPLAERSPTPFCEIAQSGAFNDHRLQLHDEVRYVYGPITTTLERAPVADKGLVLKYIARNCPRWRAPIA